MLLLTSCHHPPSRYRYASEDLLNCKQTHFFDSVSFRGFENKCIFLTFLLLLLSDCTAILLPLFTTVFLFSSVFVVLLLLLFVCLLVSLRFVVFVLFSFVCCCCFKCALIEFRSARKPYSENGLNTSVCVLSFHRSCFGGGCQ